MALVNNRKIRVVRNHIKTLISVDILGQLGFRKKTTLFAINSLGKNDEQLQKLLKFYRQNLISKFIKN